MCIWSFNIYSMVIYFMSIDVYIIGSDNVWAYETDAYYQRFDVHWDLVTLIYICTLMYTYFVIANWKDVFETFSKPFSLYWKDATWLKICFQDVGL